MFSIFSKQRADQKRMAKALKAQPLDPAALAELNAVLRTDHRTLPEGFLFKVVHESEKVLSQAHDEKVLALLTEIHRSANWEVQSRFRAS